MKSIRSFFLGALLGLGLVAALLGGLYLSPLRQPLYFRVDPEVKTLRARLDEYQERMNRDDMRIAGEGERVPDSLLTSQARAWKEYLRWRGELSQLARAHARATPGGVLPWIHSLGMASYPAIALFALLPGFLFGWRSRRGFMPAPPRRAPGPAQAPKSDALRSFEDAVKQVARIAETRPEPPRQDLVRPDPVRLEPRRSEPPRPEPQARPREEAEPPEDLVDPRKTVFMPPTRPLDETSRDEEPSPYDTEGLSFQAPAETSRPFTPETRPFSIVQDPRPDEPEPPKKKERDTEYLQMGPGWGEGARPPQPQSSELSMEDEDGEDEEEDGPPVMPPTTEVERVERRKAEVLKLARKGLTSSEISRRLRMSQDQVEFIIRLRREKG